MNPLGLAGIITAATPVLTLVVNRLGDRLAPKAPTIPLPPAPPGPDDVVEELRQGIRRHIPVCDTPTDLISLLRRWPPP